MKKFTTLLTMAFIALMSISFTSCDDDSDIAYTLDGTWKGNMLVEYGNHNALYSVIRFDQNDGFYSGTGYWIDYFKGNYWHGNNYIATILPGQYATETSISLFLMRIVML